MKTKFLLGLALVLCGGILMLTGGCATAKSEKTDMKISELQSRVESLEAVSSALTAELVEQQGKYVVRQGDTLALIAKRFNLQVEDLYRMNPDLPAKLFKNWKPGIVIIVREQEPTQSPQSCATQIRALCPAGWQVSASNNLIVLRRENPVWIMGTISNPPRMPDETEAAYFQRCGRQIRYELRMRFMPLLTQQEFEKLQTARQQAAAALKRGGSGKIEYDRLQREFENCQVPQFFTEKHSIYVEHWANITNNVNTTGYHLEPDCIDVYPPETVTEIKTLATSLKKVFQTYDTTGVVSTNIKPPLISAVLNGQRDMVELMLAENADVNVRNQNGWTPLHCAALKNRSDLAELLIAHGAEIDATNNPGATPLDVSANIGSEDVAKLLIAHKANIQGKDVRTGWTPLHGAAFHGHIGMAKLLLANGADINAKDNDGMTPLYWAVVGNHLEMVKVLLANHADNKP